MTLIVGIATVVGVIASVSTLWLQARGRRICNEQLLEALQVPADAASLRRIAARRYAARAYVSSAEKIYLDRNLTIHALKRMDNAVALTNWDTFVPVAPSRIESIKIALRPRRRQTATMKHVPNWALGLMATEDARRYAWEWAAHLLQLIEEGEIRQARRDRRRFVIAAVTLAVALRVRRALGRARS